MIHRSIHLEYMYLQVTLWCSCVVLLPTPTMKDTKRSAQCNTSINQYGVYASKSHPALAPCSVTPNDGKHKEVYTVWCINVWVNHNAASIHPRFYYTLSIRFYNTPCTPVEPQQQMTEGDVYSVIHRWVNSGKPYIVEWIVVDRRISSCSVIHRSYKL